MIKHMMSLEPSLLVLLFSIIVPATHPATEYFIYGGCSQAKYAPGTPYESNVNSVLTSLVNSAMSSPFNEFKVSVPGSSPSDVVYSLFQCRGDLSESGCGGCVSHAVRQLGTLCMDSQGGVLQLDGCFIKYDNISFLGTEDKSVAMKRCGPSVGVDSEGLTRRDNMLDYLAGSGSQYFRVGGSGNFHGVVQCVGDQSMSKCQDCLSDAIGRLKSECATAAWGDVFLGKCYARFTDSGSYSGSDDDEVQKTLAILLGLVAAVALLIVFLSIFNRAFDSKGDK